MKIELRFQIFQSNGSFFARRNSELGLDFAIRWEGNKIPRKKLLWTRRIVVFFVKIQENFEIKFLLQVYTFRKRNTWTCRFRFRQRCQKFLLKLRDFCSKSDKFSAFSPITVVTNSFSSWSLYLELLFRAHGKHVWHPCCKKLARWKLGYCETGRCVGRFFHSQFPKSPKFCSESEWMTWCPTKLHSISVWNFFIKAAAEEEWKLNWNLVFQMISVTFVFFRHPRFQSPLVVMNIYWKGHIHWFFTFICVEEIFP